MPTDPTTAERFPTIADGPVTETKPAPDYRAALEGLVEAHDHLTIIDRLSKRAYPESHADARARLAAALTHARKVLHGQ